MSCVIDHCTMFFFFFFQKMQNNGERILIWLMITSNGRCRNCKKCVRNSLHNSIFTGLVVVIHHVCKNQHSTACCVNYYWKELNAESVEKLDKITVILWNPGFKEGFNKDFFLIQQEFCLKYDNEEIYRLIGIIYLWKKKKTNK